MVSTLHYTRQHYTTQQVLKEVTLEGMGEIVSFGKQKEILATSERGEGIYNNLHSVQKQR